MTAETSPWRIVSMADVPLAAYVEVLAQGRPWLDPDRIDTWLMHRCFARTSVMALQAERPVGAVLALPDPGQAPAALYLDQVVVAPDQQGLGLARAMIRRCEGCAETVGARSMWLSTDPGNPAAHGWVHLGFNVQGSDHTRNGWPVQKDFKGPGRDRVLFVKTLNSKPGENHDP